MSWPTFIASALVATALTGLTALTCRAESSGGQFAFDLSGGVPQLLGAELAYTGLEWLRLGFGFGTFPVQRLVGNRVTMDPIPMDLPLEGTYTMRPSADFGLSSFSIFARFFPWRSGFFTELGYTTLHFKADARGDLRNDTLNTTSYGAISGQAQLSQPLVGLAFGYELGFLGRMFMNFSVGVASVLRSDYSVNLGGTAADVIGIVPGGEDAFDNAKRQITANLNDAVDRFHQSVKVVPSIKIALGVTF